MTLTQTKEATPPLKRFRTLDVQSGRELAQGDLWRRIFLVVSVGLYVLAAFLPVVNDVLGRAWDPNESHGGQWAPSSGSHLLGTDNNSKDVLVRLLYGSRTSVIMGLIATSVFLVFGIFLGVVSGYGAGWSKTLVQVLFRVVQTFPILLLLLLSVIFIDWRFFGKAGNWGIIILMALFGFFSSPKLAELVRGRILSLKNRTFIEAATALGLSHTEIIWRHILKSECRPVVLVQGAYMMGQAILVETTLTYLKFGVEFPLVSWGLMLREMQDGITLGWGLGIQQAPRIFLGWIQGSIPVHVLERQLDTLAQNVHIQPAYPILAIALTVLICVELARYLSDHLNEKG